MEETARTAAILDSLRARTASGALLHRLSEPPELEEVLGAPFAKLTPVTSRPYRRLYASSVGEL